MGISQNKIAKILGRSQSSISRELHRNVGQKGYKHQQAQGFSDARHVNKAKHVKLIDEYLTRDWSPEQIAGRLKYDDVESLHYETIYQYILRDKSAGGELYKHLRHQGKKYRKRYGSSCNNRHGIPNRIDIDERPEVANKRDRVGDWEADTIIGKNHKGAIVTLDERKCKLRVAYSVSNKKSPMVTTAIEFLLEPIKEIVYTAT